MKKKLITLLVALGMLAAAVPVVAHHGGHHRYENRQNDYVCERVCEDCGGALYQGVCQDCGADNCINKNAGYGHHRGGHHGHCR